MSRFLIHFAALVLVCNYAASELRIKRVINGVESEHSESTWLVSLQGKITTKRFFGIPIDHKHVYCGGTLISDRWILSAAHCFDGGKNDPDDWHARFASENIEMTGNEMFMHIFGKLFDVLEWKQLEYHAEKIIMHPSYSGNRLGESWPDDIALIKLKETIPLSLVERVSLIDLHDGENDLSFTHDCSVYGWGCAALGSPVVDKINRVDLPLVTDRSCRRLWGVNVDKRICAGGNGGESGGSACQGDSGGPLVCQTMNGNKVQAGVVSFIHQNTPTEYPVVFTEVSQYIDWIRKKIRTE